MINNENSTIKNKWPEWALKFKTKNTELRKFGDRIYLYSYTSKYSPELKRSKKNSGKLIGRITEEQGLIPKGEKALRKQRTRKKSTILPQISDNKEYGITFWMEKCINERYYPALQRVFGSMWQTIVGIAFNRLVFQSPLCEMARHMNNSFLSNLLTEATMDDKSVSKTLEWIGRNRGLQVQFFKEFIDKNETLVWDGSDFESNSEKMPQVQYTKLKNGTFGYGNNIMMAYSTKQHMPVYMRNLPGDIKDIAAIRFCYSEIEIPNATCIMDKGFSSKKVANSLNEAEIKFIMPLKRSVKLDYSVIRKNEFIPEIKGSFVYEGRNICFCKLNAWNGYQVFMYLDDELEAKENHDALSRLNERINEIKLLANQTKEESNEERETESNEECKKDCKRKVKSRFSDKPSKVDLNQPGQTQYKGNTEPEIWEEYYKAKIKFGTIAMVTNKCQEDESFENFAQQIYTSYKTRDQVEKMYDVLKNVIEADVSHMQNSYVYKGWMFCNFIALIWYYQLKKLIDDVNMNNHYSPQDILSELNYHQIVKLNGEWTTVERTKKKQDILDKLGLVVTYVK